MGIGESIGNIRVPTPKDIMAGYKDAKLSMQRVNVNTINVRFYPTNSPFFHPTKGELYHFTTVSLLKIEVPEKMAFIIQDDSVFFDKTTKEEWVDCRQDYPITLSADKQLIELIEEAKKVFPDVIEWYIPASINRIPVKNVIVKNDKHRIKEDKKDLIDKGISKNVCEWMDDIPSEITITPRFLYDFMDIQVIGSLKDEASKFNWAVFIMGGMAFSLVTMAFMLYIGR